LLNRLCGEKVAIVAAKPQTTRGAIRAIYNDDARQIVFVDTPGLHSARNKLGGLMNAAAESALADCDACVYVAPPKSPSREDRTALSRLGRVKCPVFFVMNKMDTIVGDKLAVAGKAAEEYGKLYNFSEYFYISALKGERLSDLFDAVKAAMPPGPKYYPDDLITDQSERSVVAELIREQALRLLSEEVPHGIAVEITAQKPRADRRLIDIEATIFIEKKSHKGIVIGKHGAMLKEIGVRSRPGIERFLGSPVALGLWVKVKEGWRDSDYLLREFGFR
jgi:GTP-binding protein Era